jgi:predicted nucleic acid-binding protein
MIGLDTGFFMRLLEGHAEAVRVWKELMQGGESAVSCLTLFELFRLADRGAIDREVIEKLTEGIAGMCDVAWIDEPETLRRGSALSHGLGIPAMDALILSGFLKFHAAVIYTTDSHIVRYKKDGVRVVVLR